jgi:hypothetical protein
MLAVNPAGCRAASKDRIRQVESLLKMLPAPIIHNKRLAELFSALMAQMPALARKYRKPHNLDIITCHDYPRKSVLERNLDFLGIERYIVLKKSFNGPWCNTLKLKWAAEYLERQRNGAEYVLFCDADDVILKDDPAAIVEIFEQRRCQALFMSTSFLGGYACMPDVKEWADRIRPGRYLNSGVYIGKRKFLMALLREAGEYITEHDITAEESLRLGHGVTSNKLCERLPEYPKGSQDQDILRYLHPEFYPDMQIDYDNALAFRNI